MLRFVNAAVVGTKIANYLVAINVNDVKNLQTLEDVEISLSNIKKKQQKGVLRDIRKFLSTTVQYLETKLTPADKRYIAFSSVYNQQHAASLNLKSLFEDWLQNFLK